MVIPFTALKHIHWRYDPQSFKPKTLVHNNESPHWGVLVFAFPWRGLPTWDCQNDLNGENSVAIGKSFRADMHMWYTTLDVHL